MNRKSVEKLVPWLIAALSVAAALLFGAGGEEGVRSSRQRVGEFFGNMPKPVQPSFVDPVVKPFINKATRKMVIKKIPTIDKTMKMPHSYWGDCSNCHLFSDGPPEGSRWASPVGNALARISTIYKIGPSILPDSNRPHPPAGRCIKCHDIVIEVPVVTDVNANAPAGAALR
jgi:hypothetical protein